MNGQTDPLVDAHIRADIEYLLLGGALTPPVADALRRLKQKADALPGIDNLTAAEVAWVTMLSAKRAAFSLLLESMR